MIAARDKDAVRRDWVCERDTPAEQRIQPVADEGAACRPKLISYVSKHIYILSMMRSLLNQTLDQYQAEGANMRLPFLICISIGRIRWPLGRYLVDK
jgi:hypothetical protein